MFIYLTACIFVFPLNLHQIIMVKKLLQNTIHHLCQFNKISLGFNNLFSLTCLKRISFFSVDSTVNLFILIHYRYYIIIKIQVLLLIYVIVTSNICDNLKRTQFSRTNGTPHSYTILHVPFKISNEIDLSLLF